ncbi:MAG: hypothetical protein M3Y56_15110 [Armatimonadota bacterium]|nr:hypothetical protein [Armatimonadota bacterium]
MSKSITLELPERVESALVEATCEDGLSQSEIVAAPDDYLFLRKFRRLRKEMTLQTQHTYTDDEIFDRVS